MSEFVPTKRNLREGLLLCFHLKKSAAESRRVLQEAYGNHAPSISTCEYWFRRFKSGNFDTDDKERPGQPKKFEDKELELLLCEDPSQKLEELAKTLNVGVTTVWDRLQRLEKIKKEEMSSTNNINSCTDSMDTKTLQADI